MTMHDERTRALESAAVSRPQSPTEGAGPARAHASRIEYASWLSDEILLVVGSFDADDVEPVEACLVVCGRPVRLDARWMACQAGDGAGDGGRSGKLGVIRLPARDAQAALRGHLAIRTAAGPRPLEPPELSQALTDLPTLLRSGFAALDAETRARIIDLITGAVADSAAGARLSRNLFLVREALRERLPRCEAAGDDPQTFRVDSLMAVDDRTFYVKGWVGDGGGEVMQLTAVSPEGSRAELLDQMFHHARPPGVTPGSRTSPRESRATTGFISRFVVGAPSLLAVGWVVEMRTAAGDALEVMASPVLRDIAAVRNAILEDLAHEEFPATNLLRHHVSPAIKRLHERLRATAEVARVVEYGAPAGSPDVSIVVPLCGRTDLLEQQLAQFAHDPEISRTDLIYVLDSPALGGPLYRSAIHLFQLYRVPFRIATLKRSVGETLARHAGVALAHGRLLLLLDADVLPDRPGWIGKMMRFYDSTPEIGALGVKLLYEDDSLAHAGIGFSRSLEPWPWEKLHYFRGLSRYLPAANMPRPVPAVSAACLMLDRSLYHDVGGLRGSYVSGDYEDCDLCFRLADGGRQNWFLPAVELYHLDLHTDSGPPRRLAEEYDRWLHTSLWNRQTEAAMSRYGSAPPAEPRQGGSDQGAGGRDAANVLAAGQVNVRPIKQLLEQEPSRVIRDVSPADLMFRTDPGRYFRWGMEALRCIRLAMLAAGRESVTSILDFASGHGRVLRVLKAAFPEARITACDLDRDAVDFCARLFGATPVYSSEDLRQIRLDGTFDLIWCGSLLTHVNQDCWVALLELFNSVLAPDGILLFTTHGRRIAYLLREQSLDVGLPGELVDGTLKDYERDGFGYRDYVTQRNYGISLASPSWVCRQLERLSSLRLLTYTEAGWYYHQDAVGCQRVGEVSQ